MEEIQRKLKAMGLMPDEDGIIRRPHLAEFSHDCWGEAAGKREEAPLELVSHLVPFLRKAYADYVEEILWDIREPGWTLGDIQEYAEAHVKLTEDPLVWMEAPVRVNLALTVDSFCEHSVNVTYPAYGWEDYEDLQGETFEYSAIMWLTRRMGYSRKQLRQAQYLIRDVVGKPDPVAEIGSRYLYSMAMEIWHELSDVNQLSFFALMPVRELLLLKRMKDWGRAHRKWPGYVLLDKGTRCGFIDTFCGSGSLLGVELEKDVKLTLDAAAVFPDGGRGYSTYGVYGSTEFWKEGCIRRWGFPRQMRRDFEAMGLWLPPKGALP